MIAAEFSKIPLDANKYCVRISISMLSCHLVEEVVYYRRQMSLDTLMKWMWYFEYLAALVKVHNPHRRVEFWAGCDEFLSEQDEIEKKAKSLLSRKLAQIKKLKGEVVQDDLFGFTQAKHDEKIERVQGEIDALQRGEANFYYVKEYKNVIKKWCKSNKGMKYRVWPDSESGKFFPVKEFHFLDAAANYAGKQVHRWDGTSHRLIAQIEDLEIGKTIETCESILRPP